MYLNKNRNSNYYVRIYFTKALQKLGFPIDLRFSLFTKNRIQAIDKMVTIVALARPWLNHLHTKAQKLQLDVQEEIDLFKQTVHTLQVKQFPSELKLAKRKKNTRQEKINAKAKNQALLQQFIAEKSVLDLRHSTIKQLHSRISHFLDYLGSAPLKALTRQQALDYEVYLHKMSQSIKTQQGYLAATKQFANWLIKQGHLKTNYLELISIQVPRHQRRRASNIRKRWQYEDLKTLYAHPAFLKVAHPFKQQKPIQTFWLPLLLLFSGLRLNEACQLKTEDIQCQDGIWLIDVNDTGEHRHLKSENAFRKVPLHSSLLRHGFLIYVQQRQQQGCYKLFDFKPTTKNFDWGDVFGMRFGRLLTRCGFIEGNRLTLHGLRHTFVDELQQANIPEHLTSELVGHAKTGITYGRYGKQVNIQRLQETIECLPDFIDIAQIHQHYALPQIQPTQRGDHDDK